LLSLTLDTTGEEVVSQRMLALQSTEVEPGVNEIDSAFVPFTSSTATALSGNPGTVTLTATDADDPTLTTSLTQTITYVDVGF